MLRMLLCLLNFYMDKLKNFLSHLTTSSYRYPNVYYKFIEDAIEAELGKPFKILDKTTQGAFMFVNADPHMEFPRPISHKIIYIGGIGQAIPKPLDPTFEQLMNSSSKGVILVSFGSVASSSKMPIEMKKKILECFSKFPDITFLWKYENDEDNIAHGYDNVITRKWVPQTDLLDHPKMLAFVTHGGQNSISEASYSGVPIICVPVFADQFRNARLVKYRKIGLTINKIDILEGKLEDSIRTILENPSYRTNAKLMGDMIKSSPMTPEERFVSYMEFAAKYGNENNLDMAGRDMNFFEFYSLDIILPLILVAFILLGLLFKISVFMIKKIFCAIVRVFSTNPYRKVNK